MQVVFESRDQEAAQFRELVERRVQFVMRRLTWLVPRARVQLCDINGPRGGLDKRCQVELKTDFAGHRGRHRDRIATGVARSRTR